MAKWSTEDVAAMFAEAAETGRRLPRTQVQGYFNVWPIFVRDVWETYPEQDHDYRPSPPSPNAIEQMMEVMRWMLWLEEAQRHLIWMRAKRYRWSEIAKRFCCSTRTSQRRWDDAIEIVTKNLAREIKCNYG